MMLRYVAVTTAVVAVYGFGQVVVATTCFVPTTRSSSISRRHLTRQFPSNYLHRMLPAETLAMETAEWTTVLTGNPAPSTTATSSSLSAIALLDSVLQSSAFWSCAIMLSIVALLYTWEEAVDEARERLPAPLMPVVDRMLAEMGGLGFIGLFLGVFVTGGPLGHYIGALSENFLGDEEILLETFEFLHNAFFEVGIGFFLIAGLTAAQVLRKIESLQSVSRAVFDTDKDGKVSLEELADILKVGAVAVDLDGDGRLTKEEVQQALRMARKDSIWDEVTMTTTQIRAEALVVRERFIETCRVSPNFRIEKYFANIFGENLKEIVELSPLTWLPLIPALSLDRSVDMARNVVSASSSNAAESCGYFLGTPAFFAVSSFFAALTLFWGCFNFWKVTQIKEMLVPTLVRDSRMENTARLLPPRFEDDQLLADFNSSPGLVAWIESSLGGNDRPARNGHERLFGAAGAIGPHLYRDSIKFHTWLVVSQIVFWGAQIVARDAAALWQGAETGNPELVVPELAIFGFYVASAIAQLWLAPQTFLNYSLVTSIEDLASEYAIQESCSDEVDEEENETRQARDAMHESKKCFVES
jgi:EF hand